jgi:hypothetical protein
MIHGGLNINLKEKVGTLVYNQCCLSTTKLNTLEHPLQLWNSEPLTSIREQNNNNVWDSGCWECERLENAGLRSFRNAMTDKFGIKTNISGPQRIDLLFDRSCNLACMNCGPSCSTFWEKQLTNNNFLVDKYPQVNNLDTIYKTLTSMDLSNVEMIQFCGGETLLGNLYWEAAELIASLVPDSKDKIELGFQTNGTQRVAEKNYKTIEKFRLVKFMISLDGTQDRFEYMRWPANWNQVVDNINNMVEKLPGNVMFFVQETTNCLNLFYHDEVPTWVKENFNSNRFGDVTDHTTQLVMHRHFDVNNITQEYFDTISKTHMKHVLTSNWKENSNNIKRMLLELNKIDKITGKEWKKVFPDIVDFYSRYL